MKLERDRAQILGGVMNGKTTGAPIALLIENADHAKWKGRAVDAMTIPRPGHADLTAGLKYGFDDLRPGLERASARETAARMAACSVCRKMLAELGITVGSYVIQIGTIQAGDRKFAAGRAVEARGGKSAALPGFFGAGKDASRDRSGDEGRRHGRRCIRSGGGRRAAGLGRIFHLGTAAGFAPGRRALRHSGGQGRGNRRRFRPRVAPRNAGAGRHRMRGRRSDPRIQSCRRDRRPGFPTASRSSCARR